MPSGTVPAEDFRTRVIRRDYRLSQMGYDSYKDYLTSEDWLVAKQRYWASDLPQDCLMCGANREVMHHKTYERVGEEVIHDLAPLCFKCHAVVHALEARGDIADLGDFDQLVNNSRAKRNAVERRKREEDAMADFRSAERLDGWEREASRLAFLKLKDAMTRARKHGVSLDSERDRVAQITQVIHDKINLAINT